MKKILVTGAAGFIGSHLCTRLVNSNNYVIGLDDLSAGSLSNLKHLENNANFKLLIQDVCDPLFEDADQIYHLACPASPKFYQRDPVKTILTCINGTFNMLRLSLKNEARLLFSSTSEVYGDSNIHPQHENYFGNVNCIGERSCYDEGKRCAESLITSSIKQYQVNACICRIFNTYGPHMRSDDGRVIPTFIEQCLNGEPITIFGDGTQTRSFCFIDDTVEGIIRLMNSKEIGPINIGNPEEITINALAGLIKEFTKSSSKIVYKLLPSDDPKKRRPNIEKADILLGWKPCVSFSDGLDKTVKWRLSTQNSPIKHNC